MLSGRRIRTTSAPGRAEPQRLGVSEPMVTPSLSLIRTIAKSRPGDGKGHAHEKFSLSASKITAIRASNRSEETNAGHAAAVAAAPSDVAEGEDDVNTLTTKSPPPEEQDYILAAMEESQQRDDGHTSEEEESARGENHVTPQRKTARGDDDDEREAEECKDDIDTYGDDTCSDEERLKPNYHPLPEGGIYSDTKAFLDIRYQIAETGIDEFLCPEVVSLANEIIEMPGDRCTWLQSKGYSLPMSSQGSFSTPQRSGSSTSQLFLAGNKDSLFGSKMKAGAAATGFGGGGGPARKKYFSHVELHHRVQGVLNKVTPYEEKYREVRNELLTLPISGADSESLGKVVNVFFMKAVREAHFSALYARLVNELCKVPKDQLTGDPKESTAYKLRRELIGKCQREFEKPLHPSTAELVEVHPAEQKEFLQQRIKDQKANIKFVGELFNLKLLTPVIIQRVLLQLMFGIHHATAQTPPAVIDAQYYKALPQYDADEVELDLLKELLSVVGALFMTLAVGQSLLPEVVRRAEAFSKTHSVARVRFIMMDLVDLARKDFVPKTKSFKTAEDVEKEQLDAKADIEEQLAKKQMSQRHSRPGPVLGGGGGSSSSSLSRVGSGVGGLKVNAAQTKSLAPPGYGDSPVPTSKSGGGSHASSVAASPTPAWQRGGPSIQSTPARGTSGAQQREGTSPPPPPYAGGARSPVPGHSPIAESHPAPPPPPPFKESIAVVDHPKKGGAGVPATSLLPESRQNQNISPEKKTEDGKSAVVVGESAVAKTTGALPPLPALTTEAIGAMMEDLKKTKEHQRVAKMLQRYTPEERKEALSIWIRRCLRTTRCEEDRVQLSTLLNELVKETLSAELHEFAATVDEPEGVSELVPPSVQSIVASYQDIVLSVVQKDIIKVKAWDEAPKIWKFWAQTVGAGSIQGGGSSHYSEEELMGAADSTLPSLVAATGVSSEKPVISAKISKANPPPFRDTKVLHQGLHNEVLRTLLGQLKGSHIKAPDVRFFITSVLTFNNAAAVATSTGGAVSPWYYMDPEADFARFRPLAVCARADDESNENRRALVDSFFSDSKLKKDDVEHIIYWWCRKERVEGTQQEAIARMNAIVDFLRKHPQTPVSATMVAKIVGAIKACNAICGEDFFDAFKRILHIAVDGADRALRELYILVELYQTGSILDFLIPAAAGFGNSKYLRKQGIVSEETMTRGKKLLGNRGDAQSLAGLGSK